MKTPVFITRHAKARGKERMGLTAKPFRRTVEIAREKGVCINNMKGALAHYVIEKQSMMDVVKDFIVYGEFMYLFDDHKLVTVYGVPNELKNHVKLALK